MKNYTKKILEIRNEQYKSNDYFYDSIRRLIEKYGEEKISNDGFLTIGDFEFNISLAFDDISYNKEEKANYLMNFFFVEIESDHTLQEVRKHFPSLVKIIKNIETIRDEADSGYILLADKKDTANLLNEDVTMAFSSIKDLITYMSKYAIVIKLLETLETEIVKYVKNIKFITISDSQPQSKRSNGGLEQTILFKSNKNLFKISILSESHEFQSYARLYVKDNNGWTIIQSFNPVKDFNIDVSYKIDFDNKVFSRMINSLFEIASKVDSII